MKLLALDTSQVQAVVAVIETGRVLGFEEGSTSVAHSATLLPLVDRVLKQVAIKLSDLDGFAVGVGPGSFTGLRIGCATVKAFAQVTGKLIVPFSSLAALSQSAWVQSGIEGADPQSIVAFVNAYQGMVFAGYWHGPKWIEEATTVKDWAAQYAKSSPKVFCGSGTRAYAKDIADAFEGSNGWRDSPVEYVSPQGMARTVEAKCVELGKDAFLAYSKVEAHYIRQSQAEIKWNSVAAKG